MFRSLFLVALATCLFGFFVPPFLYNGKDVGKLEFMRHFSPAKETALPFTQEEEEEQYFNLLLYSDEGQNILLHPNLKTHQISKEFRLSVPFLGEGYFLYKKLGKEISYYSSQNEELWRNEYFSYPVSDYYGKLVLLLIGDSSRVDLMDQNGYLVGEKSLYGALLTDYDFATGLSRAAVVFSSGEVYVVEEGGRLVFEHNFTSKSDSLFVKSCALSPEGRYLAVHLLQGKKDFIAVFQEEKGEARLLRLQNLDDKVYPHLLHMAVNSHGVMAAAPDYNFFISLEDSDWDWQEELICQETCSMYRPVYAARNFFLLGNEQTWSLFDQNGREIIPQTPLPQSIVASSAKWRILPGRKPNWFAIHSKQKIEYYRYETR